MKSDISSTDMLQAIRRMNSVPFCRGSGVQVLSKADPSREAPLAYLTEPTPEILALPDSYAKRLLTAGFSVSSKASLLAK